MKLYTLYDQEQMEVLFDVDGVLLFPWRFRAHLAEEFGITPDQTRPFFRGPFERCVIGEADLFDELPPFLDEWNWPGTTSSFVATWFACDSTPNDRVLEFIVNLRSLGVSCHIASTQERHRAAFLVRKLDLAARFNSVHFSCDVGAAKPDAQYFHAVKRRLGNSNGELLFVDDCRENVAAAIDAGWQAIHYNGLDCLRQVTEELKLVV